MTQASVDLATRITLTRAETAAALGIGLNKLDRLVRERKIPSFVEDGTRLFRVKAVEAFAEFREQEDMAAELPPTAQVRHLQPVGDAA